MPTSPRRHVLTGLASAALVALVAAGCSPLPPAQVGQGTGDGGASPSTSAPAATPSPSAIPTVPPVSLSSNVDDDAADVAVDTRVTVSAKAGTVTSVTLSYAGMDTKGNKVKGTVKGATSDDGATWTAGDLLEPSATYTLKVTGASAADVKKTTKSTFTTADLTLAEQTYATIQPLPDSTVGVGMPVVLHFDLPVKNKKAFQKNLHVSVTPKQEGSWSWISSTEVHYRPTTYWKPGTKVKASADVNGVAAGGGVYGQRSVATSFTVGRELVTKVDLASHYAKVYRNGKLVRTIAVTGGKPGWTTRSGTKLIMAKEYNKVMTNEAIGAEEEYRLVARYALRVTNSGEFLHSAPWSLGNLGVRNASHGCVGMSIADSQWLYENSLIGDPVVTTGTSRGLEQGNGWADWDISYQQWKKGSAA